MTRTVVPNRYGNYYERAAYRALHARPKEVIAAEKADKAAKAKTCQLCGRPIFAESGVIAHHGYERPEMGWQTASCPGARELPFEASKDALDVHISGQHNVLAGMIDRLGRTEREELPVILQWTAGRDEWHRPKAVHVKVTRDTFEAAKEANNSVFRMRGWYRFDDVLQREVASQDSAIRHQRAYIAEQTARLDAWKQTHRRGGEGEPVWVEVGA